MKNMKWNKKYNYPKSSRSILNGSRHYNVSNQILPSVTSILSLTRSDSEKASLAAWAERVGKSESLRIKNTAAARGTEMHQKIEDFLLSRDNLNLFEEDDGDEKNKAKKMADLITLLCPGTV